jgi:hypothetical protein
MKVAGLSISGAVDVAGGRWLERDLIRQKFVAVDDTQFLFRRRDVGECEMSD